MSILIKGMAMPKNCEECYFDAGGYCLAKSLDFLNWCEVNDRPRPSWCPITEVPPHGRLGDLDRLEQMFVDIDNAPYSGFDGENPFYSAEDAAQIIRLAPTIIESEGE